MPPHVLCTVLHVSAKRRDSFVNAQRVAYPFGVLLSLASCTRFYYSLRTHSSCLALAGPLAYLNVSNKGSTVFNWFVNISSITGLITWDVILITYARFYQGLKYNGIDRDTLPYKAPFQPYATYFGIFFVTLVTIFNGFQVFLKGEWVVNNFITAYICLPIFLFFYLIWKIGKRPKFVRLADMDFDTGRRELDASKFIFS